MGHMYSFNFKASKDIPSDIEVLNRGLLYGDGFFETINYTNQKIPLFTYHFQRIKLAHEAFGLTLQVSEEQLLAHLMELCDGKKEARIKIIFWRSSGGFYSPTSTASEVFIQVSNKTPMSLHKKKTVIYTGARNSLSTTSGFKTLSALKYVMAGKYMKDHEAEDVLLLDEHLLDKRRKTFHSILGNRVHPRNNEVFSLKRISCGRGIIPHGTLE